MKRIVIGSLAAVGALDLFVRGILLLVYYLRSLEFPSNIEIHGPLLSPDGKFKVVQFDSSGGGGLSPYCVLTFSVVPTNISDQVAWGEGNRIASFDCRGLKSGGIGHGITWSANRRLQIVLDVTGAVQGGMMELKPRDASGQVSVDYTAQ